LGLVAETVGHCLPAVIAGCGACSGGAQGGGSGGQGHAALTRRRLTEEPAGLGADLVLPQAVRPYDQAVLARPPVVGFTVLPVSVLAGRRGPSCQKGLSSRLDPRPGSFGVNVVCTQVGLLLCSQHGKDKVLVTLGLDAGEVAAWEQSLTGLLGLGPDEAREGAG